MATAKQEASEVPIVDSGDCYTGTEVEAALQEIAGPGRTTETVKQNADDIAALSGEWEKIDTQIASSSATIDFTTLSAVYRDFKVVISNVVPVTDTDILFARVSVASVFKSGTSDYGWARTQIISTGTPADSGDAADSKWELSSNIGSAAGEGGSMVLILFNPANTSNNTKILSDGVVDHDDGSLRRVMVGGRTAGAIGTSAVDGIQFLFSSGNIESGTFTLYGRKN